MVVRLILLLLGLVSGVMLAAAAFYGVFGPSQPPKPAAVAAPPPPPPPPQAMVVVAAKPIPTGTLISLADLKFAPVAADQVSAGVYLRNAAPTPKEQQAADRRVMSEIAGGVSRARFDEGAPLVRGETIKPGDAGFLAAVLRPGMRAITMPVNIVTGDAGLLSPGDHVDVVLAQTFVGHDADPGNRTVAETIAADLRVIAVDQKLQAGAGPEPQKDLRPAQTVTLEVTAVQAQQIVLAGKMGELALAIRGLQADAAPGDKPGAPAGGPSGPPPTLWAKDLSHAAAEIRPPHPPLPPGAKPVGPGAGGPGSEEGKPQVRVIRGDKAEVVVP